MNHTSAINRNTASAPAGEGVPAPFLSVVVPIYNVEPYLRRCLDSICSQSFRNLEILCVNDGSGDGSLGILREYEAKDARVRVLDKPNGGVSSARNAALDMARGEWIAWVDPDDYLLPGACERAAALAGDDVDMVFYGVRVEAEPGSGVERRVPVMAAYVNIPCEGICELGANNIWQARETLWNRWHRRSVVEKYHLRFDEGLSKREDTCFHLRFCAYARKAAFCREEGYVYIMRGNSLSSSGKRFGKECDSIFRLVDNVLTVYKEQNLVEKYGPVLAAMVNTVSWILGEWSFIHGEPLKWRADLLRRLRQHHVHESSALAPVVRELSEQLRCAQRVLDVLKDSVSRIISGVADTAAEYQVAIPVDKGQAGEAVLLGQMLRRALPAQGRMCIHFVCCGVDSPRRARMELLAGERVHVCVHELPDELLSSLPPLDDVNPHGAWLKMVLPWVLPKLSRVLMLSPGLMPEGELPPLESAELGDFPVAVVRDFPMKEREESCRRYNMERFEASTVMLMNLERMSEQGKVESWVAACMFIPGRFPHPEYDSFNRAFRGCMAYLPPEWTHWVRPASAAQLVQAAFAVEDWLPGLPLNAERLRAWGGQPAPAAMSSSESQLSWLRLLPLVPQYGRLLRRYRYYKIMSGLTWGRRKQHYKEHSRVYRDVLRQIRQCMSSANREWGL